ncbi:hypothetical protein AZE42_10877 [Rhizopogon vesiculosus]|uniref:Uncharacterized protein n=1 Tax=Rhizopogon vesiculosus TaxID=180088 RepID=A0A1J8R4Q7_9AGAM|nr:hypothetical protein AZE42_10877 [Rhizopogon vesiculosus]
MTSGAWRMCPACTRLTTRHPGRSHVHHPRRPNTPVPEHKSTWSFSQWLPSIRQVIPSCCIRLSLTVTASGESIRVRTRNAPDTNIRLHSAVTTYLPCVEMVNNHRDFDGSLSDILLDEERVLIFTRANTTIVGVFLPAKLMKITISELQEMQEINVEIIDM